MKTKIESILAVLVHEEEVAIDVSKLRTETPGVYKLGAIVEGADYRDKRLNRGVWSIGRHKETGEILAALDERFYGNPDFECVWLR